MKTIPAKQTTSRHALLRRGFLLSALGGLLCTAPLSIHAAELRTGNERSTPDTELLPEGSEGAEMSRESAAVSASGIQPAPTQSGPDENPSGRKIEVRFLVFREKQKMEGVRITVVGTDQQTVTDAKGSARLFVDPESTIRITYPGCQPQEEKIYNSFNSYRQLILINLKPEDNSTEAQKTQGAESSGEAAETTLRSIPE